MKTTKSQPLCRVLSSFQQCSPISRFPRRLICCCFRTMLGRNCNSFTARNIILHLRPWLTSVMLLRRSRDAPYPGRRHVSG
ncbi:hypothetical protein CC79DRAFT_1069710 [Sarocladium strictum]